MRTTATGSRVSIALPVHNGAATVGRTAESVLTQSHENLELVISDNASTDGTREICEELARRDRRVVYQRHATNIGLLPNFHSAASSATGTFVRWIGDDDSLEPDYVTRCLGAFDDDDRRVLVTTEIVYVDDRGAETLCSDYDPAPLSSANPVERFTGMLRLLTRDYALVDPLYALMRRELALLPRTNMLREDEVYAARLSLAGPWGHVPAPLARRHRSKMPVGDLVRRFELPGWHRYAIDELQWRALMDCIVRSSLLPGQRRSARAEVVRLYALRKRDTLLRGVARVERVAGRRPGSQAARPALEEAP
jgi:glycosyltransferase involved in cell wall biosynthesis